MDEPKIRMKRIKKPSITNEVMQCIYDALLHGELKGGDLLPSEAELSEQLNVGKSSVREAIKMLSAIGVVESVQGEGTFVRTSVDDAALNPLTYQMLLMQDTDENILELRYCIEPAYTMLAMTKATEADLEKIRAAVASLEEKVLAHTQTAQDDLAFHEAILEATHNPYMIRIGRTVLQLFEASIQKSMCNIPDQAVEDHHRILDAFERKDRDALHAAVMQSFVGWESMLHR